MKQEDLIIQKLLEHDDTFEQIAAQIDDLRRETLTHLEGAMAILKRLDEDRISTHGWIQRVEVRVDRLEERGGAA